MKCIKYWYPIKWSRYDCDKLLFCEYELYLSYNKHG